MCGICGMVDLTAAGRADAAVARVMAGSIRHRGPDGDGFYTAAGGAAVLGMRRLSIIDVAGSDQPLYNEDGSIALVFNGEIYNYKELQADLRRRGHTLRTEGDGETIIHLYEDYGLDLFRHLRGMYGFALWDSRAGRLLLAVDHIGMKPLYLHQRDGLLLFASEVKALFADPRTGAGLRLDVLDTYLSFGYMVGAETLFEGVDRLPAGHALVVERGAARLHPYWSFPEFTAEKQRSREAEEERTAGAIYREAGERLAESVRLHLRSDVPLGLFLSGGVDSAVVLALMSREAGERVQSYTVGFDVQTPDNELLQARRIAAHFGAQHHERVIDAQTWWDGLLKTVYHHDEPIANQSAVSLLLLAEHTGRDVKVVLTGLGGDELFGGYPSHQGIPRLLARQAAWGQAIGAPLRALARVERHYPRLKRYRLIGALPTYLPGLIQVGLPRDEAIRRRMSFDGLVLTDSLRRELYSRDLMSAWQSARHKEQTYAAVIAKSWRDDPYDTAQALVINTWLTGNALLHTDKVTMAASLEARVPLFDPALLRFAAQVPPAVRMQSNKVVLREAARDLLPDFARERPKRPFGTPILNWFDGPLKAHIRSTLTAPDAFIRPYFEAAALERLLEGHFSGQVNHVELVFRLLTLELWGREFVRTPIPTRG
jgi:asparagine synthase (glutamine-hydrolysing)